MNLTPFIIPAAVYALGTTVVAIIAVTVYKMARLRATRPELPATDVTARLEALERGVQGLQQELAETHHELAETQERIDFAERLLSKAREERQIGS